MAVWGMPSPGAQPWLWAPQTPSPVAEVASTPTLEMVLAAHPHCTRVHGALFSRLQHRPSQQTIQFGFRCFDADMDVLMSHFSSRDFNTLAGLSHAQTDDGQPSLSPVRLDIAHVPCGELLALQPMTLCEHRPTPAAEAVVLVGDDAQRWAAVFRTLDQQHRADR